MRTVIAALDRINETTTRYSGYVATVCLAVMTIIVTIHVIMRYGFHYSFEWTEEISRALMVWMTFLYFPMGHKRGMNIAVEFAVSPIYHTLPGKVLRLVIEALALVVLFFCLQMSLEFVERGMGTVSLALQMTMGYVYFVVPFCFVLTLFCSFEQLLRRCAELFGVEVPEPLFKASSAAATAPARAD